MSKINDRVSYLKGLAEGMKLSEDTNEGKLLHKMLEVLGEMADEMEALRKDYDELDEYVESIDDDLADMEETLFGDEDEEGCGHCGHCGGDDEDDEDEDDDDDDEDEEDDDEDEDDDEVVSYTCPHCGNEVTFEINGFDFEEENLCPACGKPLFPDDEEE